MKVHSGEGIGPEKKQTQEQCQDFNPCSAWLPPCETWTDEVTSLERQLPCSVRVVGEITKMKHAQAQGMVSALNCATESCSDQLGEISHEIWEVAMDGANTGQEDSGGLCRLCQGVCEMT
jgi:hypothetical protein